ncbi:ribbon-helix-helix protein, CopG family [Thalassotalea sp. ND16A]|uniref:ribbon-helix-helix protein, CopG family n=1 Tax=Thalassotalea sp. ND16A TaxID=1535422 RepID=UPI00051A29F1|nr:ribbon-helix-helix protein, CopG family [Thalassotalea sp. ND16A]KGJ97135.1 hypothetical protein ND16A_0057 [Thalassotalea sp. ND16A]
MTVTSIRLKAEIEEPLEALAKKLDRSKNYLINQAIKEFVIKESMADYRWQQTIPALTAVKDNDVIDESSVTSWLESWGSDKELKAPSK